jgi:hypothetical protein
MKPSWPQTLDPHALASSILGLQACTTIPSSVLVSRNAQCIVIIHHHSVCSEDRGAPELISPF